MTKENREKLYAHYKDLAANYEAPPHLNSGPTATSAVRKNSKEHVEAMLKAHPELEAPKESLGKKIKDIEKKVKKNSKKKKVV